MKKLFTLLAFLAICLGANAKVFVDADVKFAEQTEIKYYGWGRSDAAAARLSLDDGCLHYHSEEATEVNWDVQFFPIGVESVDEGVTYTLKLKIKGTPAASIAAHFAGVDNYSAISFTEDWAEIEVPYECKKTDGTSNALLIQCGSFVGDFWIEYMTITHEGKEEKPVQWANILKNGDAAAAWANPNAQVISNAYDGEGAQDVCAYSKEFGVNDNNPHAAVIENGEFVCHSKIVDPVIVFDEDTELWGTSYKAGDPKPDNTWQNQFWINFPRPMKEGEQLKVTFRYKASEAARVTTQDHKAPGDYLGGGSYGTLSFTTDWQTYEKTFSAAAGVQSIAFNLGEDKQYEKEIDFFFDDITLSTMVLDEGFFVASTNPELGIAYDLDNAVQFEGADPEWTATVGTAGKKDTWVKEVMISTVRGNDKAFNAATLKVSGKVKNSDPDTWYAYSEAAKAKIELPAAGVWKITIATDTKEMSFVQIEGDEIVEKVPVDIVANPSELVLEGVAREPLSSEEEGGTGNTWDNQFFIVANRVLEAGEETVVEFDYVATTAAKTTTSIQGAPGEWKGGAIGDVEFTTEVQHFTKDFTIPNVEGAKSIAFDMAVIKEANNYTIKNVKWYLKDENNANNQTYENLINATGTENFYVKIGAGTSPYQYGTDPSGIINVKEDAAKANGAIYNLAGQRVSKDYKGIVVKNGKKYITK